MIHLLLTVEARVAHGAAAGVASLGVVCTSPTVEAGAICAGHGTQLTHPAIEAGWAGAGVAVLKVLCGEGGKEVFQRCSREFSLSLSEQGSCFGETLVLPTYRAAPPIPAGTRGTFISLQFTVGTCVPRPTGTGVAPLPCVSAGGPIPAGCVVCAVVQVCWGGDRKGGKQMKCRKPFIFLAVEETGKPQASLEGQFWGHGAYLGYRKGPPSLPGSYTARAAGRCHGDSQGIGCIRHSTGPASPLYTLGKRST